MKRGKFFKNKYNIMRILFLTAYIGCMLVLVIESLTPGKKSAQKSNAVGSAIGGFINDLGGDQAKEVNATSCSINTKENKHSFFVGEKISLDVVTLPENSTHKTYEYISLNPEIATVSKSGVVTFLETGSVDIKVINSIQKDISSTITLESLEVKATSIDLIIDSKYVTEETSYYELEKGSSYKISSIIEPINTTNQNVIYEISDETKCSITNGLLYAKGETTSLVEITLKLGELSVSKNIKIIPKEAVVEKVELEKIDSYNIVKYVDQTSLFSPTIKYVPIYTSSEYKGYTLESLNPEIVKVENNKLKVVTDGIARIKIISEYDEKIFKEINVTVKKRSDLTDYTISYSKVMYIGDSQKIYVRNPKPSDALIKSYNYFSSNTDIATITNNGVIKALTNGTVEMTISVTDSNNNTISKTIEITISDKPTYIADDFTINYLDSETPIIFINRETNLESLFKINKFYNNSNEITLDNKKYYFSFDEEIASMNNNTITPKEYGLISGLMYYKNTDESIVSKEINLYVISDFIVNNDAKKSGINLKVRESLLYVISDEIDEQAYKYEITGSSIVINNQNKQFKVIGRDQGSATLTITPILGDMDLSKFKKEITFNVSDVYPTSFDIKFKNNKGETINYKEGYKIYLGKALTYEVITDKQATTYKINLEENDNYSISYRTITPKELGALSLTFTEENSNITHTYNFMVNNYIHVNESKLYSIDGKYEIVDNAIQIINGANVRLSLDFYEDSTYTNVSYKSSDESILKIYSDGTIIPLKQGEATVTMSVNDGVEFKEYELKFSVHKKNLIDDMKSFMYYIRKGLGHFGAFLVLGIFSTLTYMLFFKKKLTPVGIGLNFLVGFGFAWFTEFLQSFTPNRYASSSDVLIDYTGFITSAITITIIFLTSFIVKYYKKKKNQTNCDIMVEETKEEVLDNDTRND